MGTAARYAPANVDALQMLPWSPEHRDELMDQWDWIEGIPPVMGSYYVNRQFQWLYRAVVLQNEPIRESVQDYVRAANRELARKRAEFNYETDLKDVDEKYIRLFWEHFTHVDKLELEEYRGIR